MEVKVNINEPAYLGREDAAFYVWDANAHEHIGTVVYAHPVHGEREVAIYCDGEMRINLWESKEARERGDEPEVIRYSDRLVSAGISNDAELYAADEAGRLEWVNNAWFDLYMSDSDLNSEHADAVTHTVSDAVEAAKALITFNERW